MCLAVLRRDGFVSLDAGEDEGSVATQPFTLPAGRLYVNVDAHDGELLAEVCDKKGTVLAKSEVVHGDRTQVEMKWKEGDPVELKQQTVSLRFKLRNASLYSYWLED